jgi:hypothetical protein
VACAPGAKTGDFSEKFPNLAWIHTIACHQQPYQRIVQKLRQGGLGEEHLVTPVFSSDCAQRVSPVRHRS